MSHEVVVKSPLLGTLLLFDQDLYTFDGGAESFLPFRVFINPVLQLLLKLPLALHHVALGKPFQHPLVVLGRIIQASHQGGIFEST